MSGPNMWYQKVNSGDCKVSRSISGVLNSVSVVAVQGLELRVNAYPPLPVVWSPEGPVPE